MSDEEKIANSKNALRKLESILPSMLDRSNPQYNQANINKIYSDLARLKQEVVTKMNTVELSAAKKIDYETLLKDFDEHAAKIEPYVTNRTGGKRRNKHSYKKSRRSHKKSRRSHKKRISHRKTKRN